MATASPPRPPADRTIFRRFVRLRNGRVPDAPPHDHETWRIAPPAELVRIVNAGVSFADVERLSEGSGLTLETIAQSIAVPRRTLGQRKQQGRLKPDESDRLVRLARLWSAAVDLHEGDIDAARHWLTTPKRAFSGDTPLTYARTEVGAREVENLIGRLEHGVFS